PGRHAFEFRDASWFCDPVLELLADRDVALVHGDDARRPLATPPSPATWAFVRFHYGHRGRDGNYGPKELDARAETVRERADRGDDVSAYFNNDWEAFAPRNATGLLERLGSAVGAHAVAG